MKQEIIEKINSGEKRLIEIDWKEVTSCFDQQETLNFLDQLKTPELVQNAVFFIKNVFITEIMKSTPPQTKFEEYYKARLSVLWPTIDVDLNNAISKAKSKKQREQERKRETAERLLEIFPDGQLDVFTVLQLQEYESKYEKELAEKQKIIEDLQKENGKLSEMLKKAATMDGKFCDLAEAYLHAKSQASSSAKEKVRTSLQDIVSQLKLNIPKDLQTRINNFDNETPVQQQVQINMGNGQQTRVTNLPIRRLKLK